MARQIDDDDNDDDFEILNQPSSITSQKHIGLLNKLNIGLFLHRIDFFSVEDDSFEIVPSKNKSPSLINTNPIQDVSIIEKPVSITTDKSTVNELENSSNSSLPIRYGSAAAIPHNQSFDLKSILTTKTERPKPTNDLLSMLQESKPKNYLLKENNLQQLLIDNDHDRQSLVQIARQAQQDFIDAIRMD
jgi:hypothetical protein